PPVGTSPPVWLAAGRLRRWRPRSPRGLLQGPTPRLPAPPHLDLRPAQLLSIDPIATRSTQLDLHVDPHHHHEMRRPEMRWPVDAATRIAEREVLERSLRMRSLPVSEVWVEVIGEAGRRAEVAIRLERQLERMR